LPEFGNRKCSERTRELQLRIRHELIIGSAGNCVIAGIANPIFIFKTNKTSLETAPAGGAVTCKQDNQRAPPTGRSIVLNVTMDYWDPPKTIIIIISKAEQK
jgi:hypothetical protein